MAENTNSTEEVVDKGKKIGKKALNIMGKTLRTITNPVLIIAIVLIFLVVAAYIKFNNDTADNWFKKTTFEKYLDKGKLEDA